jgi:hypothetical protein
MAGIKAANVVTHSMSLACIECKETLQESKCTCGEDHGVAYQQNNAWARSQWPMHQCFVRVLDHHP